MQKMMVTLALVAATLVCGPAYAGNFTLTINGKKFDVSLDKQVVIKVGASRLRVTLAKKTIVRFKTATFSFNHPSRLSPSRTSLGNGIHQTMMASPIGTIIMVQEYSTMDPSGLVDLMIRELTKEEVKYGYKIKKSAAARKLADGKKVKGKMAVSKYKSKQIVRHVLTYGWTDAGILIVTQIDRSSSAQEAKMISTFWKTLKITLK